MSWAIAFVTMERPVAAQRFVRSARGMFPDVPIYVADQSRELGPMAEFYEAERVTVVRMPFDAGLSASRNALVAAMDVDYFALCDDDFILGPATTFASAISVLEQDEALGVVGGMLHDYDGVTERIRNWEMFFDHDERHARFTATPIYNYPPIARRLADETVYLCDAVMNFAVFRKAMFSSTIRWEERIKINGEHEDFYLNLKKHSHYRVAYLPTMAALHWHVRQHGDYKRFRLRDEGWREFMRKWELSSHLEIGTGGRPLDGVAVDGWFFGGAGGGVSSSHTPPQVQAASSRVPAAGISHMQLRSTGEQDEGRLLTASLESASFVDWIAADASKTIPAGRLLFSYQPVVNPKGDLLLWYRDQRSSDHSTEAQACGSVFVRWLSSLGNVLVWKGEAHAIGCSHDQYWQALAVPVPLWPRDATYLRFEVVSASDERTPLATGFVYADSREPASLRYAEAPAVLALCRTTAVAESVKVTPKLAHLLASAPKVEIKLVQHGAQPWVMMDVSAFSLVGVSGTRGTETPLLLAAGLYRRRAGSLAVALPLSMVLDPQVVLFAADASCAGEPLFVISPTVVQAPPNDKHPDYSTVAVAISRPDAAALAAGSA